MNKKIKLLPSIFTTGNIFFGFYSIIAAIHGDYTRSAVAILIAIIFDALDGRIARMTRSTSDFGMEYDSLADVISFGMAPGLLIYLWMLKPYGRIGWLAVFLFIICGALRLARFNVHVSEEKNNHFIGLPIPAAAGMIASYVIFCNHIAFTSHINPMIVVLFVYILSFLMVSNLKYKSFKSFELRKKRPFSIIVFTILFLWVVVTIPEVMMFLMGCIYTLSGPVERFLAYKRLEPLFKLGKKPKE
jgi:CDP-diacylglycerol---serine O-phosphatidyltransferase